MDVAEKRVHDEAAPTVRAFVASGVGVVAVSVAGDRVGRFGVEHRCVARDVAADGVLAVATDEDVFLRTVDGDDTDYRATGFGPATAVGVDSTGDPKDPAGHALVAADVEGRIARRVDDDWFDLAEVDHPVRAVDGDLVAAGDGVYRATPDGLDHVGLDDARDVAAAGPYAATGTGLYELGNGWLRAVDGSFEVLAARGDRAHAAGDGLYARRSSEWASVGGPAGRVAGLAHGSAGELLAVTTDGTLSVRTGNGDRGTRPDADEWGRTGGWAGRSLGVPEVTGLAVV